MAVALWAGLTVADGGFWASYVFGWMLLTLSWIDIRTMLLPDLLTLPLLVLGLGLGVTFLSDPGALPEHVLAAARGFGSLA